MGQVKFKKLDHLDKLLTELRFVVAKAKGLDAAHLKRVRRFTEIRTNRGHRQVEELIGTAIKEMINLVLCAGRAKQLKTEIRQYNTKVRAFNEKLEASSDGRHLVNLERLKDHQDEIRSDYKALRNKWKLEKLFSCLRVWEVLPFPRPPPEEEFNICDTCCTRIKKEEKERPMTTEELQVEKEYKKRADDEAWQAKVDCGSSFCMGECNRCSRRSVSAGTKMLHTVETCRCGSKASAEWSNRQASW